jgi:hypothetical protein
MNPRFQTSGAPLTLFIIFPNFTRSKLYLSETKIRVHRFRVRLIKFDAFPDDDARLIRKKSRDQIMFGSSGS